MSKKNILIVKPKEDLNNKSVAEMLRFIIACEFILVGFVFNLDIFNTHRNFTILLAITVIATLIMSILIFNPKTKRGINFIGIIVAFILFILNATSVIRGFLFIINSFIETWNERYYTYFGLIGKNEAVNSDVMIASIILLIVFLLMILNCVSNKKIILLTVLLLAILFASALVGFSLSNQTFPLMIIGILLAWNIAVSNYYSIKEMVITTSLSCLISLILCVALMSINVISGAQNTKTTLTKGVHYIRYGNDTLPKGNLTKSSDLVNGEEDRLEITIENPEVLHFKGFVGSKFDGKSWTQLNNSAYTGEMTGMLDWLQDSGICAQNQFGVYWGMCKDLALITDDEYEVEKTTVSIKNVGADRMYVYTPQTIETQSILGGYKNQDWQFKSTGIFGKSKYTFDVCASDAAAERMEAENLGEYSETSDFREKQAVYKTFNVNNYLSVNDEDKLVIDDMFYQDGLEETKDLSLYNLTTKIRGILSARISYTSNPGIFNGNTNYLEFVLANKNGNAVAFATIATLAYREAGVPARYVEGYYLDDTLVANMNATNSKDVTLTTKDAHAWVEVYIDRLGWMPIEVTPGYYAETSIADQIIQIPDDSEDAGNNDDTISGKVIVEYSNDVNKKDSQNSSLGNSIEEIIGIVMLILIIMTVLWVLLEINRIFRKKENTREYNEGSGSEKVSLLFMKMISLFKLHNINIDSNKVYESVPEIASKYETINEWEIKENISIVQKAVFGEKEMSEHEINNLINIYKEIYKVTYDEANIFTKLKMRYFYYKIV